MERGNEMMENGNARIAKNAPTLANSSQSNSFLASQDEPNSKIESSNNKRKLDNSDLVSAPDIKLQEGEPVLKKKREYEKKESTASSGCKSDRGTSLIQEPSMLAFPPETKSLGALSRGSLAKPDSISAIPEQFEDPPMDDEAGIFDDADEDDTFEYPAYKPPPSPPPPRIAPFIRPDLVDVILESPPRAKVKPKIQELESKEVESSESPLQKKRKKQSKPTRRVMSSKKEVDIAEEVIRGKVDLLRVLPEEDCRFLGETFWIFTLQQLENMIKNNGNMPSGDPSKDGPGAGSTTIPATKGDSYKYLLEKLATSKLLRKSEGAVSESNSGNPSLHSGDFSEGTDSNGESEDAAETDCISVNSDCDQLPPALPEQLKNQTPDHPPAVSLATTSVSSPGGSDSAVDQSVGASTKPTLSRDAPSIAKSTSSCHIDSELPPESLKSDETEGGAEKDKNEQNQSSGQISRNGTPPILGSSIDAEHLKMAEARLETWKESILSFRAKVDSDESLVDKEQFPVSGPLSCLLPVCARHFFASISIKYAFDFLKLKKTETGVVVDMLRLWRQQCKLSEVSPLPLAKHLLGINMRIEAAIGRVPNVSPDVRAWMGCPLMVLTGAAKDFVITESRIFSATEFVERRTKELSKGLADWRIAKGLPPLKGTGKVAMISGWKSVVKEAMDIEAASGSVITGVDFVKEVQTEMPLPKEGENETKIPKDQAEPKKPKKPKKSRGAEVEAALLSKTFLSTVFKAGKVKAMASVGIFTAQELLDADKKPEGTLIQAMIKMRSQSKKLEGSVQPSSCVRLIYDWCQRVKAKLNEIEKGTSSDPKPPQKPQKDPHEPPSKPPPSKPPPKRQAGNEKSPWDSLSSSTKVFLGSMGINTAEEFLSTRTTDIASEFVKWREKRNMSVLKGLGAIASVSGWKAQARKAAKAAGMDMLSEMVPNSNPPSSQEPRTTVPDGKSQAVNLERLTIKESTDRTVLFGLPKRKFGVGQDGSSLSYFFELSVRKSSSKASKNSIYVTYIGSEESYKEQRIEGSFWKRKLKPPKSGVLPILSDVSGGDFSRMKGRSPFSTLLPGCGAVELTHHGVQPLHRKDVSDLLMREIEKFMCSTDDQKKDLHEPTFEGVSGQSGQVATPNETAFYESFNVFQTSEKRDEKRFFLFLPEPIEKGQSVELKFLPTGPPSNPEEKDFDGRQRHWLQEQIALLSLTQLRDLLDYVNDTLGGPIYQKLHKILKVKAFEMDRAYIKSVVISRRRMHWVALRINEQLQKALHESAGSAMSVIMPPVAAAPLWTSEVASSMRALPNWKASSYHSDLKREIEREIATEFSSKDFAEFSATRKTWCPMAERLFENAVDILSSFLTELESYCDEEKLVNELCSLVSNAVLKVDSVANEENIEASKFTDLVLTYKKGTSHLSNALPSMDEVLEASSSQAYVDAMSLCDEPPCRPPARDSFRVVATTRAKKHSDNESIESAPVTMQSVDEMRANSAMLDRRWYIERQIIAVVETVSLCGIRHLANRHQGYKCLGEIKLRLVAAARAAASNPRLSAIALETRPEAKVMEVALPRPLTSGNYRPTICEPHSSPFFLAIVWPILSLAGWKLDVGTAPYDVTYLTPGRKKGNDSQARLLKQERAKQRGKLARQTNALGFNYIPKRTKRLLANVSALDENLLVTEAISISAKEALDRFLFSVQECLPNDDKEGHRHAGEAVDHICACFDELAPMVLYDEEKDKFEVQGGQRLCDVYSCDILMRLLLVMPSMLQQSGLRIDEVDNTLGVIRELTDFLAVNHHDFLDAPFHVPREYYESESTVPPFLVPHLSNRESKESPTKKQPFKREISADDNFSIDVVLPSDRADLTDFIDFVMSQAVVCRATQDDIARKNRRVTLGFPGLACRHCMGFGGEGRSFFSSMDSLCTAGTVIEKHLQKCPTASDEVKAKLAECRSRHAEQRKMMPQGSQGAFFARLWDRLRSSRTSADSNTDVYVSLATSSSTAADANSGPGSPGPSSTTGPDEPGDGSLHSDSPAEFKDHVRLLDYLQNTSPWDTKQALMDAIDQYYYCLDYGGRIYNTSAMPLHFNSEWLLSKIAPRERATGGARR